MAGNRGLTKCRGDLRGGDEGWIELHVKSVPRFEDLNQAWSVMTKERVGAVIILANLPVPARQVAESALRYRLPAISVLNQFVQAGGLMSYGASVSDKRRHPASDVDKILKGAKPVDLPVERPTTFELAITRKTAKSLGLAIPQSLRLRADQVLE